MYLKLTERFQIFHAEVEFSLDLTSERYTDSWSKRLSASVSGRSEFDITDFGITESVITNLI